MRTSLCAKRRPYAACRGIALPVVLLIVAMMLVTSASWFEAALLARRNADAVVDHLQSFHAADAALVSCSRALTNGSLTVPAVAQPGEPQGWRRQDSFERQAIAPIAAWPGSARAPQCVVEAWRIESRPLARAYLVTARGFGVSEDTQSWLQNQLVIEAAGDVARVEHHWRHVVARPF